MQAALLVLVASAVAGWDLIVERYHRFQMGYGSEASAFRAAAALSGGNRGCEALVRDWALARSSEGASVPQAPGNPIQALLRDEVLGGIALAFARIGDTRAAEEVSGFIRIDVWRKVTAGNAEARLAGSYDPRREAKQVEETARGGELLGALRLAGAANERSPRFDRLGDVLEGLQARGLSSRELALGASAIDPCGEDGWALHPIAVLQARRGELEGAFRTALRSARLRYYRHEGPPHVMRILAAAGLGEKALEIAGRYEQKPDRVCAMAQIARGFAEGGHRDAGREALGIGLRLLEELPDPEEPGKSDVMKEVALAQWSLGEVAESRKSFRRAALLSSRKNEHLMTKTQVEAGDLEGAMETAKALAAGGVYPGFEHIASEEARRGDFAKALEAAERLPTFRSAGLMAFVGVEQRGRGDHAAGRATFRRALAAASEIPASVGATPSRANAYRNVAFQEARSGDARESIEAARRETIPLLRASLLLGVAEGLETRIKG